MTIASVAFGLQFITGAVFMFIEARKALRSREPLAAGLGVLAGVLLLVCATGIFIGAVSFK